MQLENLKRWHWIVIGLLLGLLVAGVRSVLGPDFDRGTDRDLQNQLALHILNPRHTRAEMEHPATNPSPKDRAAGHRAFFDKIIVHPPLKDDPQRHFWVTGLYWEYKFHRDKGKFQWDPKEFLYKASTPYVPKPNLLVVTPPGETADPKFDSAKAAAVYSDLEKAEEELETLRQKRVLLVSKLITAATPSDAGAQPSAEESPEVLAITAQEAAVRQQIANGPTVKDYLDQLKAKYPSAAIPYRFAWNEVPMYNLAIWTVGMTVVVGGIWPTVLQFLLGAGFGRAPAEEEDERYRLSKKPSKTAEKPKPSTELTLSDLDRLKALEEELAPALADAMNRPAAPTAAPPPPVPVLSATAPAEPAKVGEMPKPTKTFGATGGDFYPTEVHADTKKK